MCLSGNAYDLAKELVTYWQSNSYGYIWIHWTLSENSTLALQLVFLSAFRVVDEPLAFCMMVKFGSVFLKWQSVCNFGIVEIFYQFLVLVCLYITQVLHVIFHLHIFSLCNNFILHKVLGTIIVHWRRPDSFWLAQLKAWAIMSYFWPRSMLICGVTRPQWVNSLAHGLACFGACKTTLTNNVLCITQINNNYWYEHNKTNTRKYTLCDILYALMANWSVFSSVSVTLGIKNCTISICHACIGT